MLLYGQHDPSQAAQRLGVIPFNLDGLPHGLVAAVLGTERGIGVRNGCFCAHPHVTRLLGIGDAATHELRAAMAAGDRRGVPGMVRISFGRYNTADEVEVLADALALIARRQYRGTYVQDRASGDFAAQSWAPDLAPYFRLQDCVTQAITAPRCA